MSGRALARASVAVMALTVLAACSSSQTTAKRTATPFPSPPRGQLLQSPSPYSGPGGGPARQPTGKLQPKDLMSKDPKTMTFGGGPGQNVSATFPGEYVYPPAVSVFTNVAIPLVGQVAYLVSPDSTADAVPVGTYSNHNPAPASGRVLQIETAKATDANAFAQGPLKTSIESAYEPRRGPAQRPGGTPPHLCPNAGDSRVPGVALGGLQSLAGEDARD